MLYRPKRENFKKGKSGEKEYVIMLECYCTCLERINKEWEEQCNIANVVEQSEQLKAFLDYVDERYRKTGTRDRIVDEFLSL